jgi:hypothetical protein
MNSLGVAVSIFALTACGGTVAAAPGETPDATVVVDAASADDASDDLDAGVVPCALGAGVVVLDAATPTNGSLSFSVAYGEVAAPPTTFFFNGSFDPPSSPPPSTSCNMHVGACWISTPCDAGDVTVPTVSAGVLTLQGAAFAPIAVAPESDDDASVDYEYPPPDDGTVDAGFDAAALTFRAGDTLCVSGTGGDVPAFPNLPIDAPAFLSLTSPAFSPPSGSNPLELVLSSASDAVLGWTPDPADDTVAFTLFSGAGQGSAVCVFDASAGTGTVPRAVLTTLASPPGSDATLLGSFEAYRERVYGVGASVIGVGASAVESFSARIE